MLIIQYSVAENTWLMEFILFVGAWNTTLGLPKKSPKTALPNLQGQGKVNHSRHLFHKWRTNIFPFMKYKI